MPSLLRISRPLQAFTGLSCPLQIMGSSTAVCGLCPDVLLLINPLFLSQKCLLTTVHTYFVFSVGLNPDRLDTFLVLLQLFFWQILYLKTDSLSPRCSSHSRAFTLLSGFLSTLSFTDAAPQLFATAPPFWSPQLSDNPKREAGYVQVLPMQGTDPWESFYAPFNSYPPFPPPHLLPLIDPQETFHPAWLNPV